MPLTEGGCLRFKRTVEPGFAGVARDLVAIQREAQALLPVSPRSDDPGRVEVLLDLAAEGIVDRLRTIERTLTQPPRDIDDLRSGPEL